VSAGGRTPAAAVRALLGGLGVALSCVTDQVVRVEPGGYRPGGTRGATLAGGEPVALAGVLRLALVVRLRYVLVPADGAETGWEVARRAYEYLVLDGAGGEFLAFHWQPGGRGPDFPHLHVGGVALRPGSPLFGVHLPPRVAVRLEEVIELAITELGVRPRRADWAKVLAADAGR
jgi:hypothetical protein